MRTEREATEVNGSVPPIDLDVPSEIETATFAMG